MGSVAFAWAMIPHIQRILCISISRSLVWFFPARLSSLCSFSWSRLPSLDRNHACTQVPRIVCTDFPPKVLQSTSPPVKAPKSHLQIFCTDSALMQSMRSARRTAFHKRNWLWRKVLFVPLDQGSPPKLHGFGGGGVLFAFMKALHFGWE